MVELKHKIEALLFSSEGPLTSRKMKAILPDVTPTEIQSAMNELETDYEGRAFTLERIAGGAQLLTRPEHADIIAALSKQKGERRLSPAALETLAIVAYKQPIKRVDIEAVRGVQAGEILRALMERGLIRISGREDVPGNPLLYGTTDEFLNAFGLESVKDLPKPEEVK